MSNILKTLAAGSASEPTDEYFNQTVLLLHGDGTNGAQNNTFLDSSTNNFTITRNGNTTQGTFSPFSADAGKWSVYFNGTSDYLRVDTALDDINTTTHPFTFDFWIYPISDISSGSTINPFGINDGAGNNIFLYFGDKVSVNNANTSLSSAPAQHEWTFVQVIYDGSTVTVYHNGVSAGTVSSVTFNTAFSSCVFGIAAEFDGASGGSPGNYLNGYISNFRVIDSAITPLATPTAPTTSVSGTTFLGLQSNRFVDSSTSPKTISVYSTPSVQPFSPFAPSAAYSASVNGGSGYFDGTGDYLTAGSTSDWTFLHNGAQDYTIEAFVYLSSVAANQPIISTDGTTNSSGILFNVNTSRVIQFTYYRGATGQFFQATSTATVNLNSWNYIAATFTASTNTCLLYVNGVADNSVVVSSVSASAPPYPLNIGRNPSVPRTISSGYISSVRISDSVRSISGMPTTPYTSDANTELLLNFTNAGILDNTGKNNLETVGNAQIDTTTKKYGTGSMEFDGTGDYLKIPSNQNLVFGTGDFTIEFWLYFDAVNNSTVKFIYDFRNASATSASILAQESTNSWTYFDGAGSNLSTGWTSGTFTTGTWYHIAICRSSGTTKFFVDGTSTSSVADTSNYANGTFILASRYNGQDYLDGFIDDLRITKGVARYTANFTPPTAPFPDQ